MIMNNVEVVWSHSRAGRRDHFDILSIFQTHKDNGQGLIKVEVNIILALEHEFPPKLARLCIFFFFNDQNLPCGSFQLLHLRVLPGSPSLFTPSRRPILIASPKPHHLPKPRLLLPSYRGLRLQRTNLGEKTNMQFIAVIYLLKKQHENTAGFTSLV